jgi:hypothetical protein
MYLIQSENDRTATRSRRDRKNNPSGIEIQAARPRSSSPCLCHGHTSHSSYKRPKHFYIKCCQHAKLKSPQHHAPAEPRHIGLLATRTGPGQDQWQTWPVFHPRLARGRPLVSPCQTNACLRQSGRRILIERYNLTLITQYAILPSAADGLRINHDVYFHRMVPGLGVLVSIALHADLVVDDHELDWER